MKVEEIITKKILEYLEKGVVPWQQPWMSIFPRNYVSKWEYSGVNFFLLSIATKEEGYRYPYFITYKQAGELGGNVKKGEKGHDIIFQTTYYPKNHSTKRDGEVEDNGDSDGGVWVLRYYKVFNIDQCEGIEIKESTSPSLSKDKHYEDVLETYVDKPKIVESGNRASYSPSRDIVSVPPLKQFRGVEFYYATLFHELVHSTGAKTRLARFSEDENGIFGSEVYSKEELIAELGSAFLCARHTIDNTLIENSASYLHSWLKVLQNNPKWIISASGKAQRAVDYISGKGIGGKSKN